MTRVRDEGAGNSAKPSTTADPPGRTPYIGTGELAQGRHRRTSTMWSFLEGVLTKRKVFWRFLLLATVAMAFVGALALLPLVRK
ncbi:hypothetical protein [Kibdelosporangium phytohabitans]|uniref:hypothetical protein n=1 Tax=Kibdelosporangium phytohabitans TaxID=860235 RepID=UPI0012FC0B11|nr:hypothetical protein [Kibdelosporangium phytohabitans]MBE1461856.1 hypothetical protein [Kibdelosporangium phytohabitans]